MFWKKKKKHPLEELLDGLKEAVEASGAKVEVAQDKPMLYPRNRGLESIMGAVMTMNVDDLERLHGIVGEMLEHYTAGQDNMNIQ